MKELKNNKFETGQTYSCRSICDHNCIWEYEIIKRTKCFVWIKEVNDKSVNPNHIERRKITIHNAAETVKPTGNYSMAPTLRA